MFNRNKCNSLNMSSSNLQDMHSWNAIPYDILVQIYALLPIRDRFQASSSCKTWRSVLVNHVPFWKETELWYDDKRGWEPAETLIDIAGHCFRNVAVFPVKSYDELLFYDYKSYSKSLKSLPTFLSDKLAKCTGIHRLQVKFPDDLEQRIVDSDNTLFPQDTMNETWNGIAAILKSSGKMEHLELGYHIAILNDPKKLEVLKNTCCSTLKTLHCTQFHFDYSYHENKGPFDVNEFKCSVDTMKYFKNLTTFALNIQYATDPMLDALSTNDRCQMKTLIILCTDSEACVERTKNWTSDEAWKRLLCHSPKIVVCIATADWSDYVLKPVIPIKKLSLQGSFDQISASEASYIIRHFKKSLRRLEFHCDRREMLFGQRDTEKSYRPEGRPLLNMVVKLKQLRKLVITGCRVYSKDVIRIGNLRNDLKLYIDSEAPTYLGVGFHCDDDTTENFAHQIKRAACKRNLDATMKLILGDRWKWLDKTKTSLSYWCFLDKKLLPGIRHNDENEDDMDDIEDENDDDVDDDDDGGRDNGGDDDDDTEDEYFESYSDSDDHDNNYEYCGPFINVYDDCY